MTHFTPDQLLMLDILINDFAEAGYDWIVDEFAKRLCGNMSNEEAQERGHQALKQLRAFCSEQQRHQGICSFHFDTSDKIEAM